VRLLLLSVFLAMFAQGDTGRVEIVLRETQLRAIEAR
jgi:hypothetical protein